MIKSMNDFDVLIIGAGAAGLAALQVLATAGLRVMLLEARNRIGGRIHTIHDPLSPVPIELGPEFIHGRPPELWQIVGDGGLTIYDGTDASCYINNGEVEENADSWDLFDDLIKDMKQAAEGSDQSFEDFLATRSDSDSTRHAARGYIEGFNAADAGQISIKALAEEMTAADKIDGDRVFRFTQGYAAVARHLLSGVPDFATKLRLNTEVVAINWTPGSATLHSRNVLTGKQDIWNAPKVIVTVPLGVLQAGSLAISPEPNQILDAARRLRFGQVYRVVFRFREAFWEQRHDLQDAGFILSREPMFPTWWTTLAVRSTLLVGWHAGARAENMSGTTPAEIVAHALNSLSRIMKKDLAELQALVEDAYFHDWQADPYARGSYSYVPVGALDARKQLAIPVEETLYFAGEATDQNGHSATVHGALSTGQRAALQALATPK